jgi:hypothetical protein
MLVSLVIGIDDVNKDFTWSADEHSRGTVQAVFSPQSLGFNISMANLCGIRGERSGTGNGFYTRFLFSIFFYH